MFSSIQGDLEQPRGGAVIQDHEDRLLCIRAVIGSGRTNRKFYFRERADVSEGGYLLFRALKYRNVFDVILYGHVCH